jgi:hypothetical protein
MFVVGSQGTHVPALLQQQIADSQQVFPVGFRYTAIHSIDFRITQRYAYGAHDAAIRQQQIANASVVFRGSTGLPPSRTAASRATGW